MRQALCILAILLVTFAYAESSIQDLINQNVPESHREQANEAYEALREVKSLDDIRGLDDSDIKELARQALPAYAPASVRTQILNKVKSRPVIPADY